MDYFSPADESEFLFGDEYDDDQEIDIHTLSSLHADVPLAGENAEIKSNCIINVSNGDNNITLISDLQNAVISGNSNIIKSLVKNNSDYYDIVFDSGWTPLTYASNFGHKDTISTLLDAGADINFCGSDGCTALMAACKCTKSEDSIAVLNFLIDKGANTLLRDKNNKTLLIHAVRSGKLNVVNLVLKHSPSMINEKDSKGWTALDWAISKSFEDVMTCLLQHGATVYDAQSDCISLLSDEIKLLIHPLSKTSDKSAISSDSENISQDTINFTLPDKDNEKSFVNVTSTSQDFINLNIGVDGDGYQKYGQLELLLCGLNLSYLIPKFHEHDVNFEQLLYASNDDLVAVGIHQLGVRNRILSAIKDWHSTEWHEASLPNFSSTALTFGNLQAVLRTSSEHILYISSALRYAKHQLKTYPQVLKPPASMQLDRNPDEIVIGQVEDLVQSTHKLCKALKTLHGETSRINTKSDDQNRQVDCIQKREATAVKKSSFSRWKLTFATLPVIACFVLVVTKRTSLTSLN